MHMRHDEIRQKYGKSNTSNVCFKVAQNVEDENICMFFFL